MVVSSSQLYEVVSEMKQYFTMKNTLPLSVSAAQPFVGARDLRHNDVIWELPCTRYVERVLEEHVLTSANPVVWDIMMTTRRATQAGRRIRHEPSGEVPGKTYKNKPPRLETSFASSLWLAGFGFETADAQQSVRDTDSVH